MTDIDVHHLAAAYALDALDDRERSAFESHYGSCAVCHGDVQDFRETLTQVASSLAAAPPPSLKARVMAEVATTRQFSPALVPVALDRHRRNRSWTMFMAAAAALALIVIGLSVFRGSDSNTYSDALTKVLDQPDAKVVTLDNKSGTNGSFKVAWSKTLGQAVLIGEELPTAPSDKAYELWLLHDDQATAMYVLDPAGDGNVHSVVKTPTDPTGWAITVEPKAGTPVATGDIIYIATL